jgi:hypothetical protein
MNTVLITGNTYPVKDKLKELGAKWDARNKGWKVPATRADEAKAIMAAAPAPTKRPTGGRRTFIPCGYPGCNPHHCDECDGEGRYARY